MLKGSRKTPLTNHTFDSILGEGMVIDGRLKVSGSALIHGTVTGNIEADPQSELVMIGVGETGRVLGDIQATQVMIGGVVTGNVFAATRIEMMSSGVVQGNLHYDTLVMDEGAQVHGQLVPKRNLNQAASDSRD
jgi:cytoskeletal protein CcmA (bactofilin family)